MSEKPPLSLEEWTADRQRIRGENDAISSKVAKRESDAASRLADEPLSSADAESEWASLDSQTSEAAQMRPWDEGGVDVAGDLRNSRDTFTDAGMSEDELADFRTRRAAFQSPDAELESAFERAGLNERPDAERLQDLPPLPESSAPPQMTDVPMRTSQGAMASISDIEGPGASADFSGMRRTQRKADPFMASGKPGRMAERALPKLPGVDKLDRSAMRGEEAASELTTEYYGKPYAKYEMADDSGIAAAFRDKSGPIALLAQLPKVGVPLAKAYGAANAAVYMARKTAMAALNHEEAINRVINHVARPAADMTSKVVKRLVQGTAPAMSSSFVSGDTHQDYAVISKSVNKLASDPEAIERFYGPRYGGIFKEHPEFYGAVVTNVSRKIAYLDSKLPRSARERGLIDDDYDPPRSEKLKFIQAYKGVNSPFESLLDPSIAGISAIEATHPETLGVVRRLIADKLTDPKVVSKLTTEQSRQLSIIMGIPVRYVNSPAYISGIQQVVSGSTAAQQQQPQQAKQPNLSGAQEKSFANMYTPPSEQNAVDNARGG